MSSENTTTRMFRTDRRGASVKVRLYGGAIVERVVWDEEDGVVYLCSRDCYTRKLAGDPEARPIGFPSGDVMF